MLPKLDVENQRDENLWQIDLDKGGTTKNSELAKRQYSNKNNDSIKAQKEAVFKFDESANEDIDNEKTARGLS